MVYRHTPLASAMRGYTAGGSRASIGPIDDSKLMQETNNCQGMRGEFWGRMEAPQNYGFTSVTADPDEDEKTGMRKDSAEGMVSFMGGNRSFPVMGPTDDRRHRLFNLAKDAAKGAVAMFGLREWGQQFLNTEDGMHMTGNKEKKIRISLVENKNGKQQQQGQQQQADAGGGRGGATSGSGTQQKEKGQKTLHKEQTDIAIEQNGKDTTSQHGQHYAAQRSGSDSSTYTEDRKKSTQTTADHVHIRFKDNRIFNDEMGNWATSPIMIKKDSYCKE